MAKYKIWYVDHDGFGTKLDGCGSNEGLESPGENTLQAKNEESAQEEFEQLAQELRQLGDGWEKADFVLSEEDDQGDGNVIARDYTR